jgi:hypothetical protein
MTIRFGPENYQDTSSVCRRNPIADITYTNPDYIIRELDPMPANSFPYLFTERTSRINAEKKAVILQHLKDGKDLPPKLFHDDWIIGILLLAILLFSVARTSLKSFIPDISRFFFFRGTNEEGSRDLLGIFQWKSTLLNFSSFLIIGIYAYFAASYYRIFPWELPDFINWLICFGVIVIALTLRHITCFITGLFSGESSVFLDYLHTVYQSYRFASVFLFILAIMMAYTSLLEIRFYFLTGVIVLSILYLIRIFRLLIIFINRNISIFYLILYLCALEILPVSITIKYFSGLA